MDFDNSTPNEESSDYQQATKKHSHKSKKSEKTKTENDVYLVQIPKFLNPHDLKGVCISVSDETQFKANKRKYVSSPTPTVLKKNAILFCKNEKCDLKLVRFVKHIKIQRHLKTESVAQLQDEAYKVPFPEGIKTRHPILGVN